LGVEPRIGYCSTADVLVVQKRLNPDILATARAARLAGCLVVYDCDDCGAALGLWAKEDLVREMFSLAHLTTTNTPEFADTFRALYGAAHIEVIPDAVDYDLAAPLGIAETSSPKLQLLWFGNAMNLDLLRPYLALFEWLPDSLLTVCTDERARGMLSRYPHLGFEPWSRERFPAILRSAQLTFLPHGDSEGTRAKSNNRMITSIAWGVPAVASRTPAYERTAQAAGIPEACFGTVEQASECVERLRLPAARTNYLTRAQPAIWREHAPQAVARRWLQAFNDALSLRQIRCSSE